MSIFNIKQSFILYKHLAIFTRLCLFVNTRCVYSTQLRGSFCSRMLRQISHLFMKIQLIIICIFSREGKQPGTSVVGCCWSNNEPNANPLFLKRDSYAQPSRKSIIALLESAINEIIALLLTNQIAVILQALKYRSVTDIVRPIREIVRRS